MDGLPLETFAFKESFNLGVSSAFLCLRVHYMVQIQSNRTAVSVSPDEIKCLLKNKISLTNINRTHMV